MTTDLSAGSSLYDSHSKIDSALSKLDSVGRLSDAQPIIDDIAETTNFGAIDSDPELTADAKIDRHSVAYAKTMNTVAQRLSRAAEIAAVQHSDDHAAVFGIRNEHLAESHRRAKERAAAIVDPRERQQALTDSIADGDTVMARALAQSAVTTGDLASTNVFSDEFPHLDSSLQRLWDAARSKNDRRQLGLAQYNAKDALKPSAQAVWRHTKSTPAHKERQSSEKPCRASRHGAIAGNRGRRSQSPSQF